MKKIIPKFIIDAYHRAMPLLGAIIYRFPSKKIKIIGITGTNGKSTTVEMLASILKEAGYKVGILSSIKFEVAGEAEPNMLKMTMPGRLTIQKMIRRAVNKGCDYMIIEVTSEGIKQYRHLFVDFDLALITNLSPEHIESHGGFENYKRAKGELFKITKKIHIINLDDKHADYFLGFKADQKIGYGIESQKEMIRAVNCSSSLNGVSFSVNGTDFNIKMPGRFNIYNALAGISTALSQGIDMETIKRGLERVIGVDGRMEEVITSPFRVFVDYAFTPNALEKVYKTIKEDFGSEKMICLLGSCGGGRDKWKRPVLGSIAGQYCNQVIVTNEDPYDEDPMEIIEQVAKGTRDKAIKILDRREAIAKAISLAKPGDSVIITGKGCEPWICVAGGKKITWDDREVVKEEFSKIKE